MKIFGVFGFFFLFFWVQFECVLMGGDVGQQGNDLVEMLSLAETFV